MSEPEVRRVAEFLAAHAVLLLGLAILAALTAAGGVIAAVSALREHRGSIRNGVARVVRYAGQYELIGRALARSRRFMPSGYLTLHLVLGLALTVAVSMFIVLAENVLGGGELVAFDLAFAEALHQIFLIRVGEERQ